MPIPIEDLAEIVGQEDYHQTNSGGFVCEVMIRGTYCNNLAPWTTDSRAANGESLLDRGTFICERHYEMLYDSRSSTGITPKRRVECNPIRIVRRLPT